MAVLALRDGQQPQPEVYMLLAQAVLLVPPHPSIQARIELGLPLWSQLPNLLTELLFLLGVQ